MVFHFFFETTNTNFSPNLNFLTMYLGSVRVILGVALLASKCDGSNAFSF